ncbi:MAG: PQQ-binding-like beta-propeller repeat protein [Planctomycetes bacterium]|nr:PQQ-binding-like beta-propeller repeat protein [Planctomycetota bacterium]
MSKCGVRLGLFLFGLLLGVDAATAADWTRFRGPNGTGVADDKNIPVKWTKENYLFKTEIPGKGHSSPIISKGKVFLQSSSKDLAERYLICVDANTGKIEWSKTVPGGPAKTHAKNSAASCTPAADGERVYAIHWDGSELLLTAYDYKGELIWKQPLGTFKSQHGPGMSPILVGGTVVVTMDQDGKSELLTFDAKTGKPGWSKIRDHERASYSTPFLLEKTDAGPDLIVASTGGITAYDPKDGKQIWNYNLKFDKMRLRMVGSAILHQGSIFAVSGDGAGDRLMVAIKPGGQGDIAQNLVWDKKKRTPYVPTPLAKDGLVFWVTDNENLAVCVDAKTGNELWDERLGGGGVSASPILIDGNILTINEQGTAFIFPAAKSFELLAKNELKEQVYASPAVANGKLYIRGFQHLYCIGNK